MEKETKKYLIIGTVLVISIGIGVVIWKKYQSSSSESSAASDQSNQDELALLSASLEANAYAGQAGAASYSPSVVGTGTPTSLADEVLKLEAALGFGPTPATPPAATGSPTPSPTTPPTTPPVTPPSATGSPAPVADVPIADANGNIHGGVSEMIRYKHGAPIFEMDGVPGEGVTVS